MKRRCSLLFLISRLCCALWSVRYAAAAFYIAYQIWSKQIHDGWGIRWCLQSAALYTNVCVGLWVLVNAFVPRVSIEYVNSAYAILGPGVIATIQIVLYPALQTWRYSNHHSKRVMRVAVGARGSVIMRSATITNTAPGGSALAALHTQPVMRVLSDSEGFTCFLAFARSEFNSENVLFIQAVEEYRCSPPHTVDAALRIYHTFVSRTAQLQVNLSHTVVRDIESVLGPHLSPASPKYAPAPAPAPASAAAGANTSEAVELASPPSVSGVRRLAPARKQSAIERKTDVGGGADATPSSAGAALLPVPAPLSVPRPLHLEPEGAGSAATTQSARAWESLTTVFDAAEKEVSQVPPNGLFDCVSVFCNLHRMRLCCVVTDVTKASLVLPTSPSSDFFPLI